ncbi:hypothetical protein GCM10028804_15060 [Larkinella terrae]
MSYNTDVFQFLYQVKRVMAKSIKQLFNRRSFLGLAGLSTSSFVMPTFLNGKKGDSSLPIAQEPTPEYQTLREGEAFFDTNKIVISAYKSMRYYKKKELSYHYDQIRIYRMECPDFKFGIDYSEYFRTLDYKKAALIFQGKMEPSLDNKFRYEDEEIKLGTVYCYWIGSAQGVPEGPLPVKARDPEIWWPYETVQKRASELQKKFPALVQVNQIGVTTNKRPLVSLKVGQGKRCIALVGAVHAGEAGPEIILYVLEKLLENHPDLLKKVSVVAIPSANPDMRERQVKGNPWYLRRNANLVDINRNFPANWGDVETTYGYSTDDPQSNTYRGAFAESENETVAIMQFMKSHKPEVIFSYHCLASIAGQTLAASKDGLQSKSFVDRSNAYANTLWQGMANRDAAQEKVLYLCTAGSMPTWSYKELNTPAFDIEAPFEAADLAQCKTDQTNRALLKKYQEMHLRGILAVLKSIAL